MNDRESFHFNALYGERPGFDPRMNQFPFEFTWLDGPALKHFLDVLSVSQEILSIGRDEPFAFNLQIGTARRRARAACASAARRSRLGRSRPRRGRPQVAGGDRQPGRRGERRRDLDAEIDLDGNATPDVTLSYPVTADGRALSKIVRDWAEALNATTFARPPLRGLHFAAEAQVDIVGNAKLRIIAKTAATRWPSASMSSIRRQRQRDGQRHAGAGLHPARSSASAGPSPPSKFSARRPGLEAVHRRSRRQHQRRQHAPSPVTADDRRHGRPDLQPRRPDPDRRSCPIVSGYTVTFAAPWPSRPPAP